MTDRSLLSSACSFDALMAAETHATARRTTTVVLNKTILSIWYDDGDECRGVVLCATTIQRMKEPSEKLKADESIVTIRQRHTRHEAIDYGLRSILTRNVHGTAVLLQLQQIKLAYKCKILLLKTIVVCVTY